MGKINVLSFAVANLIAAGEVVDRPASVIKELMENSIDAGATRVTVEIQNGGITFMRVTDNGCGMEAEDLPVAIRRHATSKIKNAADLEGILTLGFRGEALAAIASVSHLRILSKTENAQFGAVLEAHGGEEITVTEQGCGTGTSVIVENLFYNVPARRKFLKKDATESMAVGLNVEKIALSHPEIAVRLIVDGNVRLETAGDGSLRNAIHALYGKEFSGSIMELQSENEGIAVRGFIGRTDNFKANRNYQNFFVNGRYVKSKTVMAALEQAYTSYMPPEKFPCCVLFLDILPGRVDVNVHPAKLEVKFSNEKAVFEAVYYTVRTALEQNVTRPVMKLEKGFQFPGGKVSEATVPVANGRQESLRSRQISYDLEGRTQPQPQERMTAEEYRQRFAQNTGSAPKKAPAPTVPSVKPAAPELGGNRPVPPSTATEEAKAMNTPLAVPDRLEPVRHENAAFIPTGETKPAGQAAGIPKPPAPTDTPVDAVKTAPIPEYRIVGDVFRSYVLVETGEKLLLIDQHAAHERILFEQLKAGLKAADVCSQMLMLPLDVMMTSAEVEILRQYDDELRRVGFTLRYARNTVSADAIPEGVETGAVGSMLQTMAGRLLDNTGSVRLTRDILFEKALYQAACKAAIKAGRDYAPEHIEWLVHKLMELPDITFCPHGRPVAMELSKSTLDRQFDRTGF